MQSKPAVSTISAENPHPKRLIFRLSSLGDVILSSSVLSDLCQQGPVDWVVAREFAVLFKGDPRIRKIWEFDRAQGLSGWISFCRELIAEDYDEVLDLHGSLRTHFARFYFLFHSGLGMCRRQPVWRKFSKERWRLVGLYFFKGLWPKRLSPRLFVQRFSLFSGGSGTGRPDLTHLLSSVLVASPIAEEGFPNVREYYCVMPGSKWAGKRWPVEKFFEVIRLSPGVPVVLGGHEDVESVVLVNRLKEAGVKHYSGVGRWDLRQVAHVLASSTGYVGNDTGLAHLAEALGVAALVIYGPTTPEMGFAPWRQASGTAGLSLWCRPCGKDGRRCYRLNSKYLCMTGLDAAVVAKSMSQRAKST